jgi:putative colanic acid biosynthesis UDP-glucose lipid carrier transferase
MRGESLHYLQGSAADLLVLEPPAEALPGVPKPTHHWRFASDMRAALMAAIFAADVLAVAITGIGGYLIRNGATGLPRQYWGHLVVGCVTFVLGMQIAGMYRFAALRRHREHLVRLTCLWAAVVLMLIAIIYLTRRADQYSRAWMLMWALGGWSALVATRVLAWRAIRRFRGQLVTRTAVIGHPIPAQRLAQRLADDARGDVEIVGVFEAKDALGQCDPRDGGALARLSAADTRIDEIVFALPHDEVLDLDAALGKLGPRVVDIKVGFDLPAPRGSDGGPLILVPVWQRPLAGSPTVLKRAIDICASLLLLASLLPLMAVIAALVKFDTPGPVLFRQQRFGISKKPFKLYKFRSMRCAASNDPSVPQARRHDPRVTRIGRFLRRTSLDELPQLLNVLKGDMSLVGPRPHATLHDEKYAALIDGYVARHRVKPGITGWAQVHGWRGETDTLEKMQRRVEYDIYYMNNWSLRLDFEILFKTLAVVLGQRNAY